MKTQILLLILFMLILQVTKAQRFSFAPIGEQTNTDSIASFDRDFREMPFQFTLITPPLSTNGVDFHKTVNDVSINTFLGVSAGTESLEVGGFTNVNLYYNKGVQVAGFANINGIHGDSRNYKSSGVQAAGFGIINGNSFTGLQASGFGTINKEFSGVQATGFVNLNYEAEKAIEAAGFANINYKVKDVFQAAGFANVVLKGESKTQVAGFANIASEIKGVQAAGFANVATDVDGVQASGFINVARNIKGIQLAGFINICDSIDGVPISFISFVRKNGYRSFEFSTSEWAPMQVTYRMGVDKFYNIYTLSKLPKSWDGYAFGFGFGHRINLSNNSILGLEVTNHQAFTFSGVNRWSNTYNNNQLLQFKPVFNKCLGNGICMNFGPTLNYSYSFKNYNGTLPSAGSIQPFWKIKRTTSSDNYQSRSKVWVGFTAGISMNIK